MIKTLKTLPCYLTRDQSEVKHPATLTPNVVFKSPSLPRESEPFEDELQDSPCLAPAINAVLPFATAWCLQVGFTVCGPVDPSVVW